MKWRVWTEALEKQLAPDVGRFVLQALDNLEREQVVDAPGVISGVVSRMQAAESPAVRGATGLTAELLRMSFTVRGRGRIGA